MNLRTVSFGAITGLIISTAALAQPKNDDVVGIRLGMSSAQVKAAIQQHSPTARIEESKFSSAYGLPETTGELVARTCINRSCPEMIVVKFLRASDQVWAVTRDVDGSDIGLVEPLTAALLEKYGPPTAKLGSSFQWSYKSDNTPVTIKNSCEPDVYGGGQMPNPKCGYFLNISIGSGGSAKVRSYATKLAHSKMFYDDQVKLKDLEQAAQAQKIKSLEGKRPKI